MPVIAVVKGIEVSVYWNDHLPPHFHAKFAENEMLADINELEPLAGKLPQIDRKKSS